MTELLKYPRTAHIEGSRLQPGDEDLAAVPWRELAPRHLVVEEKLDGANAAVSFARDGELRLQSRGHFLRGGAGERQFALLKAWARCHQDALRAALGTRHVLYGEWLFAKHTVFYDALPHYFHEFDVLDVERGAWLSTPARRALLAGLPIVSVPVLAEGRVASRDALTSLVRRSLYKGPAWRLALAAAAAAAGLDPDRVRAETDPHDEAEGLYVKWEEDGRVLGRYKWIRATFLAAVLDSGSHWFDRPILENRLREGVDVFAPGGGA